MRSCLLRKSAQNFSSNATFSGAALPGSSVPGLAGKDAGLVRGGVGEVKKPEEEDVGYRRLPPATASSRACSAMTFPA